MTTSFCQKLEFSNSDISFNSDHTFNEMYVRDTSVVFNWKDVSSAHISITRISAISTFQNICLLKAVFLNWNSSQLRRYC